MERYGQILTIAIPIFLGLVLLEKTYGYLRGEDKTPVMDMVSSLLSGVTNSVKDVLGLSISILSYAWMVKHWAFFQVEVNAWVYLFVFIVLDFQGYWVHRWAHEINFFWNKHLIHHSSEEFNLACALRQSISSFVNLFTFFLLPAALLGVPVIVVATIAPLHLFAQFWYHTRHIGKMGFLENILVTPSHHRVHHAINPVYLDKNYSQIFIVWDKLFGTFQAELPEVPPVYGITHAVQTWNPIKINFQHLWLMAKDAFYAQDWRDKLRVWWKPTGWRPTDVAARFPIQKIGDVYHFEKYNPYNSPWMKAWASFQLICMLLISMHFFGHIAEIGSPGIFIYGLFIFISVYSFSELMDKNPYAPVYEFFRMAFGLGVLYWQQDWFGLNQIIGFGRLLIAVYLVLCFLIVCLLSSFDFPKVENRSAEGLGSMG